MESIFEVSSRGSKTRGAFIPEETLPSQGLQQSVFPENKKKRFPVESDVVVDFLGGRGATAGTPLRLIGSHRDSEVSSDLRLLCGLRRLQPVSAGLSRTQPDSAGHSKFFQLKELQRLIAKFQSNQDVS